MRTRLAEEGDALLCRSGYAEATLNFFGYFYECKYFKYLQREVFYSGISA
jgi:hypothetical protein